MTDTTLGPVQPHERIQLVDILRGFALFGILHANWSHFSGLLSRAQSFWIDGSFYTSYSFLFGLGFSIQMIRAEAVHRPFVFRYLWRTALLYLIGAWHFVFIWTGDILRFYGLVAPVLLVVRKARPWLILVFAAAAMVVSMAPWPPDGQMLHRVNPEQIEAERLESRLSVPQPPAWCEMLPGLTDRYRSQVCQTAINVRIMPRNAYTTISWWRWGWGGGAILCLFLLGLYAGRRRILHEPLRHTRFLIAVAGVFLVLGVAGNTLSNYDGWVQEHWGIAMPEGLARWIDVENFGDASLAVFYMSAMTLLLSHSAVAMRILRPLGAVGRIGLTNYLAQSIIFSSILGQHGFDVMRNIRDGYSVLLLYSVFAVQILYSVWWLKRFRFGPAEWIWRSLTWWRLQPMRIGSARPARIGVSPEAAGESV